MAGGWKGIHCRLFGVSRPNGRGFIQQRQAVPGQSLQGVHGGHAGCPVMPDRSQFPLRFEERGRQQQDEKPFAQRESAAPGAEFQIAQQMKAHIGRHHGHAQRREQLQHCRRQERNAQHLHRALAQVFGTGTQPTGRGLHAAQCTQRGQPPQPVQQEGVHAAHLQPLRLAGCPGTPAHQHHEQRNERGCRDQHGRSGPAVPRHGQQDHQGHQAHTPHGTVVARQPWQDGFGLFRQHAGCRAGMQAGTIQRRTRRQRGDGPFPPETQAFTCRLEHPGAAPGIQPGTQQAGHDDAGCRPHHTGQART